MSAAEGAEHLSREMREHFGLEFDPCSLPGGEFLTNDAVSLTTHTGTHVDAPAHYGSKAAHGAPRTIDEMPLDWFYGPGIVLDLSMLGTGVANAAVLEEEFSRIGCVPAAGDIVLLRTGAAGWAGTQRYFTDFAGLDASAVNLLLDRGVRVIGTDAFSLDAPFPYIIKCYQETADNGVLWPAHMTGRRREYCQVERLANLESLPRPHGFMLACFPVKVAGAGAGWTRAVALLGD